MMVDRRMTACTMAESANPRIKAHRIAQVIPALMVKA
jgi:hypothetical protein